MLCLLVQNFFSLMTVFNVRFLHFIATISILFYICYIHNVVFVGLDGGKGSEFDWLGPAVRC